MKAYEPTRTLNVQRGVTIDCNLEWDGERLTYFMDWSDNTKVIYFTHADDMKVLQVRSILEARMDKHFEDGDDFITSDIEGIEYVSKEQ